MPAFIGLLFVSFVVFVDEESVAIHLHLELFLEVVGS